MRLIPDRDRFFTAWAMLATGRPRLVLGLSILLAALSIWMTITGLGFMSDRSDLIDPSLPWQQRYAEFKERFSRWDDAIVVVDTHSAPPEAVERFWTELRERVIASDFFDEASLIDGFDDSEARGWLTLLESPERLDEILRDFERARPGVTRGPLDRLLRLIAAGAEHMDAAQRAEAITLVERVRAVLDGESVPIIDLAPERHRITSPSGRYQLGFVSLNGVTESGEPASVNQVAPAIGALRAAVESARAAADHPDLEVGVTGTPVLESDETEQSMRDGMIASIASLVLISALMIIVYRGVTTPLLALAALLLGVAWSFGWVTLAVGHLQVLSMVFAIVLLGLGVDNAIHLIARLELVHPDHDHMPQAVAQAMRGVGAGIVTGAVTTAAAFGAMALTPFSGVAEMGLIAAGGVLLCCISVMTGFPALLELLPHPERILRTRHGGEGRPFAGRLGLLLDRRPRTLLALSLLVVGAASLLALQVRYDPDLVAIMPQNAEGVVWERRLATDDERSTWHAVVLVESDAEAQRLAEALHRDPRIGAIGGAGAHFVAQEERDARHALVQRVPQMLVVAIGMPVSGSLLDAFDRAAAALDLTGRDAEWSSEDEARAVWHFQREQFRIKDRLDEMRSGHWPMVDDLPEAMRQLVTTDDGALIFRIYPPESENGAGVLSRERLGPFVSAVLEIAPSATGPAVQIYESTRIIIQSYQRAALYAAVAIFLVLLWDFRRFSDALCAFIPVGCGGILTLGALALLGIPLNFANTIVLPLLMGIGVDAGVHAVHRWRLQPHDAPAGLAGGTGRAVSLTVMTTVLGFACLMLAEHQGVRSLGMVMSIGLLLVWCSTVFILPPILRLRSRGIPAN